MLVALALIAILLLCAALVALQEVGRRMGLARRRAHGAAEGVAAMEGAAFALLGLLLAFTFNGAATRFEGRRLQIVDEANALGTAWLRIDLLPPDEQPRIRELMRGYLDQRLMAYDSLPEIARAQVHFDSSAVLQKELWTAATLAASHMPGPAPATLMLPALNESFDLASSRLAARMMHPPPLIWVLLGVLTAICCLLAGFDMSAGERRSWPHILALAVLLTVTIYVIIDFEYPRLGLMRLDDFDGLLRAVRAGM